MLAARRRQRDERRRQRTAHLRVERRLQPVDRPGLCRSDFARLFVDRLVNARIEVDQQQATGAAGQSDVGLGPLAPPRADLIFVARGLRQEIPHPTAKSAPVTASPLRFSETPVQYRRAPPLLGEHTSEVLQEVLGMTSEEIAALGTKRAPA
ncbi:MAG: hypothetical protein EON54_12770 [Alcaligenaceae bacterium]|nr:MAG: hypothetical protein EON54_12770 [Alcaligenaceae bacterium]